MKTNFKALANSAKQTASKYSPQILLGVGIAGMITSTILAVKATPKAIQIIEQKKKEENVEKLNATETVKATWKCYIPAVVTGVSATVCLIGSNSVSSKRAAAIAAAYEISKTTLNEYKDKVVETEGITAMPPEELWMDFGYGEAVSKDPVSNSYMAEVLSVS